MNIFARLFTLLAIVSAFAFAETTSVSPVDSTNSIQELEKKHAVWIKLEGDVEPSMFDFCARAIDDALKENPDYIIFEINTFGGRLDAAFDIVDTIMAVKGPETIALVKKKAISAGSLIALACKHLYMLEATTIGDCAPIVQGGDGTPQIVGEKIQSPLRAKFRNLAQRNGYPELLSSSFVTPELEILELKAKLDKGKKTERDTVLIIEGEKYEVLDKAEKEFWGAPKILVKEGELLTMTDKEAEDIMLSATNALPSVINVDVGPSVVHQPFLDHSACGTHHFLLADASAPAVPGVPAHRWSQSYGVANLYAEVAFGFSK